MAVLYIHNRTIANFFPFYSFRTAVHRVETEEAETDKGTMEQWQKPGIKTLWGRSAPAIGEAKYNSHEKKIYNYDEKTVFTFVWLGI